MYATIGIIVYVLLYTLINRKQINQHSRKKWIYFSLAICAGAAMLLLSDSSVGWLTKYLNNTIGDLTSVVISE
ncbi:hypothetical protein [Aquibacillus salsiterrae]|uniref:Uncharacterized protein n=1 Tax=Aquibacillus salsiterrae TaxID=2950439 RepID=A0A9X3WHU8_9BACI|nr:hypothetical protein [Aquibacillus salsiterrae]MDC3417316.1 hypothetical protein [Aquibacillus salsiterrae]